MAGVGLDLERGDGVLVRAWVVVEAVQTELGAQLDRDRLVRVVAGLAGVDGHVGPSAAVQDGRALGLREPSRVPDLDDQLGEPGRGGGQPGIPPAPVGVRVIQVEGGSGWGRSTVHWKGGAAGDLGVLVDHLDRSSTRTRPPLAVMWAATSSTRLSRSVGSPSPGQTGQSGDDLQQDLVRIHRVALDDVDAP